MHDMCSCMQATVWVKETHAQLRGEETLSLLPYTIFLLSSSHSLFYLSNFFFSAFSSSKFFSIFFSKFLQQFLLRFQLLPQQISFFTFQHFHYHQVLFLLKFIFKYRYFFIYKNKIIKYNFIYKYNFNYYMY